MFKRKNGVHVSRRNQILVRREAVCRISMGFLILAMVGREREVDDMVKNRLVENVDMAAVLKAVAEGGGGGGGRFGRLRHLPSLRLGMC